MFKKLLQLKLKILAKKILAKYKPEIVGITGSVGKTSARDSIAAVLKSEFNIRKGIKNYNNEIGVPLTIIGAEYSDISIVYWTRVFFKALKLILIHDKNYPKILILEMGIDRIGDMDYLLNIAKPKIGVVTNISESHLEFLKSLKNTAKEKGKLIQHLPRDGWAVLNYDDKEALAMKELNKKVKVLTYGLNAKADIYASGIELNYDKNKILNGISFKLNYKKEQAKVVIIGSAGNPVVQSALAGASLGFVYGLNIKEVANALNKFKIANPGRVSIVRGIKNTLIIDDTYNASPESTIAAINTLAEVNVQGARRWAVLGDMLELGAYTKEGHQKVGKQVIQSNINKLIVVGERAREIARVAKNLKEENIFHFSSNERAGRFLQERMREGDAILVKGSQGMRMEKIVKELMAEPMQAKNILVRQGDKWKRL